MRRLFPVGGKHERGFALVAAVFIVVVLALLGIMMVTIGGMQRATTSAAAQGARAYHAARSGIEWGAFQAVVASSCAATTTIPLSVAGLDGFTVTVGCTSTSHRERAPPEYNVYVITSTATSGAFGEADYVSRRIQITVTSAP
jgi:MSHA biogenesis protein MshP